MIIFSWTLTPNQVIALRCVQDHQAREEESFRAKKEIDNPLQGDEKMRSWHSSCQLLFRERLIQVRQMPRPSWMRSYTGKTYPKWEITEKGRLMLMLVGLEIEQQREVLGETQKALRSLNLKQLKD